jgi:two-component system, NtrC family, sensor histidine kinase HydH
MRTEPKRRIVTVRSHMGPTTHAHEEIQRQEMARLFGHIAGGRLLALPLVAAVVAWMVIVEPPSWRTAVLVTLGIMATTFFVVELLRYRRRGMTESTVPLNLGGAVAGQILVSAATGGLASPLIYAMLPIAIIAAVMVPRRLGIAFTAIQIATVWIFAVIAHRALVASFVPQVFGGGAAVGAPPLYHYAHATVLTGALLLSSKVGRIVARMFRTTLQRTLDAQQESLDSHAERLRELTALSGEIAHELKNPLASVKGLSALLEGNVADAKGIERLGVLRHEVDRMQGILDEFLNFSRPLVPLAVVETDLTAVCEEVAALHEGLGQERGVTLSVVPSPAVVRCDPRKVKQILINLVQNAIDASPAQTEITIAIEATTDGVRIRVADLGPGVDASLGNVFEPGVTSKTGGSGLGLTIARALARQHGGELVLRPSEGGGTVADLVLPREPRGVGREAA